MPRCFFLPGLGGTSLGSSPSSTDDTWVNYAAIAVGLVGRLRLAADGVSPGPPDGVQMYAGVPLPDYYAAAIGRLTADLQPHGYTVVPWGFDWRLTAPTTAASLAAQIAATVAPADPCTIVAHSFGGIVARLAWAQLSGQGQSGLVRRIITLGSPHWGSYGGIRLWSGDADQLDQLSWLSAVSLAIYGLAGAQLLGRYWSTTRLIALANTFPSLYWTLPSLLAPDAAQDPNRSAIYSFAWPASLGVSATWLEAAQNQFQLSLADPSSQPPPWVFTTVAGVGLPTANRLLYAQILGQPRAYAIADVGDGTVTTSSALMTESAQYTLTAAHMDLPRVAADAGLLAQWVLDPRGPPTPPPPAVVVQGQLGFVSAGPPSPLPIVAAPPIPRDP